MAGALRANLSAALMAGMTERRAEEIQRGISLVGPHRDDIALSLGVLPAKGYVSHGESWSFALALRLGSFHRLRADGVEPVLVSTTCSRSWIRSAGARSLRSTDG